MGKAKTTRERDLAVAAKKQNRAEKNVIAQHRKKASKLELDSESSKLAKQLSPLNLRIRDVASDGNCLFRAIAVSCGELESYHSTLRERAVEYLRENRDEFSLFFEEGTYDSHLAQLKKNGVWGDHLCLVALSRVLDAQIFVHQFSRPTFIVQPIQVTGATRVLQLGYILDEHYVCAEAATNKLADSTERAAEDMAARAAADALAEAKAAAPSRNELICMQQSGCDDIDEVRRLLAETDGDVDAVVEILVAQQLEDAECDVDERHSVAACSAEAKESQDDDNKHNEPKKVISAAEKRREKEKAKREKRLAKAAQRALALVTPKRDKSPPPNDSAAAPAQKAVII